MKRIGTTVFCALAGGFVGGLASQTFLSPPVAYAQSARIIPSPGETHPAREVRAERFIMVDPSGTVRGELKLEKDNAEIALYGPNGEPTWKAPVGPHVHALTGKP